ncbi:hypothetical protein LZ575_08765 [Antarcticibacterium sp. 1MA-6-2]|uniref:hypothetical protein n=1 Tax=Antarcticibacterium sp. 1MA-6-2 TaxID=2908210 RepID=UPI001F15ADD2|nr:hypothetical protein [Antarcticibacterium sp. 1MA-6-2]UJH92554.1 hypothetical protein LZ575_08765 [Antarcticibacterium sp. 1MA-6-2]
MDGVLNFNQLSIVIFASNGQHRKRKTEKAKQKTVIPKPKTINLFSYIKFLWHSTNEHGVHSPFVFSLLTECLYKKENKAAHKKLLEFRKTLLNDKREIEVTDFGAKQQGF